MHTRGCEQPLIANRDSQALLVLAGDETDFRVHVGDPSIEQGQYLVQVMPDPITVLRCNRIVYVLETVVIVFDYHVEILCAVLIFAATQHPDLATPGKFCHLRGNFLDHAATFVSG